MGPSVKRVQIHDDSVGHTAHDEPQLLFVSETKGVSDDVLSQRVLQVKLSVNELYDLADEVLDVSEKVRAGDRASPIRRIL